MPRPDDLVALERLLATRLIDGDLDALQREAAELPDALRSAVACIDARGFRIASLLCAKLRFERLSHGSPRAIRWFRDDERGFTAAFRRYHREVPPTAHDPRGEARSFEEWCAGEGL